MKIKKVNQKSSKGKNLATKKKKKDFSKITTEEFFQSFEDDTDDDNMEKDETIGMIRNIWILFIFCFDLLLLFIYV